MREAGNRSRIPLIEGGLTPGEVAASSKHGAAKLFPAHVGGTDYLRSLRDVLPHASIMPTGGIKLAEVEQWLRAGAFAVGVGSDLSRASDLGEQLQRLQARSTRPRCIKSSRSASAWSNSYTGKRSLRSGVAGDTFNTAFYLKRTARRHLDVAYLTALGTDIYSELVAQDRRRRRYPTRRAPGRGPQRRALPGTH